MTNAELVAHATRLIDAIETGQRASFELTEIGERLEQVLKPHEGRVFKITRRYRDRWFRVVGSKPVPFQMPERLWLMSLDGSKSEANSVLTTKH